MRSVADRREILRLLMLRREEVHSAVIELKSRHRRVEFQRLTLKNLRHDTPLGKGSVRGYAWTIWGMPVPRQN
jgi:hypothetical protein